MDTVVLMYFLLVGREELLFSLIGEPIGLPLAVYDPSENPLLDDPRRRSDLLSEMHQAIRHYAIGSRGDPSSKESLDRLCRIQDIYNTKRIQCVVLSPDEANLAAYLQSHDCLTEFGLKFPLGPGEASCVAIAWLRGVCVATDDNDALHVLEQLHDHREFPHERIRRLLVRAATSALITRGDANLIHEEMRRHGFWDTGRPFS